MDFELDEERESIRKVARDFARKELSPYSARWDKEKEFSREVFKKMGELGLTGMLCPENYGGSNLGRLTSAIVYEELAQGCMATASYLTVHNMVAHLICHYGNDEQRKKYVIPLATGELLGGFALTEPGAGSDAASIKTIAVLKDGAYILNGNKIFITSGGEAEVYAVMVKTDPSKGAGGISTIIVEKGTEGFTFGKREEKMGMNASPLRELIFEDCRVPKENLLSHDGNGFKIAMSSLDGGRVSVGAVAVGISQASLDAALSYSNERIQFGKPIGAFQGIQFMLADMATQIEAARNLVYKAAYLMDQKRPNTKLCSMAKLFATDVAMKVTTDAVQIFGGYGYMKDYPVEKYMRDAKATQIVEGTNQIQRIVISKELFRELNSSR